MKVIVYLHNFPPGRYVGGELMTKKLLGALVERGHTVDIYVKDAKKQYTLDGMTIRPFSYFSPSVTKKYDVYVSHPEIAFVLNHHTARHNIPYIGIVHNTSPNTMRGLHRLEPHITIANSYDTLTQLPNPIKRPRQEVIYPPVVGIDQVNDTGTNITAINMSPTKGFDVVEHVAKKSLDFPFLAVRGGHGLQAHKVPSNIKVVPQTPDINPVCRDTCVFLHPSIAESYGMALAEMTVAGIPSVINRLPVSHEVMGSAGLYPHNKSEWVSMTHQLMMDQTFYDDHRQQAIERGIYLHEQSQESLDHWVHLMETV